MKLSFKFFCVAYLVVILSTGFGGAYLIQHLNDSLWNARVERVNAAVDYAANSFLAFADISDGELSQSQKNDAIRQIQNALDDSIRLTEIRTAEMADGPYATMGDNDCAVTFTKKEDRLLMESVCKLNTGARSYYLTVSSDFTEMQQQRDRFWRRYGIVVFGVSAVSGLLLFALARRITKPLHDLTQVADEIALGSYGRKVAVKGADDELSALSESINAMSAAIEQNIKEMQAELQRRNTFVADFTHEVKTPMTAIIGYAQVLRAYDLEESEKDQAAAAIYNEAKRLEKLSLQLLDLYVYQNVTVALTDVDLLEVGAQLESTLHALSAKYDVAYEIAFEGVTVRANPVLLLSLLSNLADNACKASFPKSKIRIFSRATSAAVQICVEDHGRGIAKEHIQFLTEPFYREDKSRSRKLGGAGLGLAWCKEIATLHNTALVFESEKNKGTRVSFTLPKGGEKQ